MKNVLVTGGCGFIASNFIQRLLKTGNYFIVNVDKMNYCANEKNISKDYNFEKGEIEDVDLSNYCFYKTDINNADFILDILRKHKIDILYHFAAQTHVDQSFGNSNQFVIDNVMGTSTLLECCREYGKLEKFIHVSTDEVYGEIRSDREDAILEYGFYDPTNPYAATKAAAELMVKSYHKSYKLPVIITRSNNVYGPRQYWEKVVPKFIYTLANNRKCPVYGQGQALRKYLFVDDAVEAYQLIMESGRVGEIYEMASKEEYSALDVSRKIISKVKPEDNPDDWLNYVEDRKFHDQRYLVNGLTLYELGWKAKTTFEQGLIKTADWYLNYAIPKAHWTYDDNITIGRKN